MSTYNVANTHETRARVFYDANNNKIEIGPGKKQTGVELAPPVAKLLHQVGELEFSLCEEPPKGLKK